MIGADAGKRIIRLLLEMEMSNFRVHEAVDRTALDHHPSANAGAHGDINVVSNIFRRSPFTFRKRSRIDVCLKRDRDWQRLPQRSHDVEVSPGSFWRRCDVAIGRGVPIQVNRPETGDAERGQPGTSRTLKESNRLPDALLGRRESGSTEPEAGVDGIGLYAQ